MSREELEAYDRDGKLFGCRLSVRLQKNGLSFHGTSYKKRIPQQQCPRMLRLKETRLESPPVRGRKWSTAALKCFQLLAALAWLLSGGWRVSHAQSSNNNDGPPVISAVASTGIASTSVGITWSTDLPATSQVEYGLTPSYDSSTPLDSGLVTDHAQTLTGLSAGTLYHYRVRSQDENGLEAVSDDFTFTTSAGGPPRFGHVFIVVEENHSYSSVIGNPDMPYLNSLANQYGLATNYFADTHPSIGNYFMLTTGRIITNDDGFADTVSEDNIVRQLLAAGNTWKSYAESLPSAGYTDDGPYPYARRHNPLSYLSDVVDDPTQINNLVPFWQFATDLANGTLPQYSFIVPNLLNDAHDGSLADADTWLQANMDPLIQSSLFQQDGLLVIVFDESFDSDAQGGGGQVAMVVVSPAANSNYSSTTFFQHESTLRLLAQGLGLTSFPGAADTAPDMSEFFVTAGMNSPAAPARIPNATPFGTAARTTPASKQQ